MKKYLIVLLSISFAKVSFGQNPDIKATIINGTNQQKSANTKDILTTLFRAGLDNLLGEKHEFTFSSAFFGIDSLLHGKAYSGELIYCVN